MNASENSERSDVPSHRSPGGGARLALFGLAFAVALVLLHAVSVGGEANLEELALDAQTKSLFAEVGGHPIHCQDARDLDQCVAGSQARKASHVVLWLGNSQLHAVNQLRSEDRTSTAVAHSVLEPHGLDLVTLSQPNANLQEHYVIFEAARRRLPVEVVVLPLVFDDTRESGVRHDVASLATTPEVAASLARSTIGKRLAEECATASPAHGEKDAGADMAALEETVQEAVEGRLNAGLEQRWKLWAARPQLRGELFVRLHHLRNAAFGIDAQTARPVIPGRYADNLAALDALLSSARAQDIAVLGYVAPLRSDVAIPYVPAEYDNFKRDVTAAFEKHGAKLLTLETLVPGELWGSKDATGPGGEPELDFMHFQGGGHVLLGERVAAEVESIAKPAGARP